MTHIHHGSLLGWIPLCLCKFLSKFQGSQPILTYYYVVMYLLILLSLVVYNVNDFWESCRHIIRDDDDNEDNNANSTIFFETAQMKCLQNSWNSSVLQLFFNFKKAIIKIKPEIAKLWKFDSSLRVRWNLFAHHICSH